jgi:hypothetical protein
MARKALTHLKLVGLPNLAAQILVLIFSNNLPHIATGKQSCGKAACDINTPSCDVNTAPTYKRMG